MSKKLLSPKNDYTFKRIFGHIGNEEITKNLLSAIMKKEIKEIDLEKNRILEKDLLSDKFGILDIRAKLDDNIDCDVEMQMVDYEDIQERILYYWSKLYSGNLKSGESYITNQKVVIILITAYEIKELRKIKKVLSKWQIREENYQNEVLTDRLEFYILELPKYKRYKNISRELENWVKFIESPEEMEMSKIENENIKKAREELEKISDDEYEQELALKREMFLHDMASLKGNAYRNGEKAGLEKGKIEIAKRMLKDGLDIEIIIKYTGLTKEEIEKMCT